MSGSLAAWVSSTVANARTGSAGRSASGAGEHNYEVTRDEVREVTLARYNGGRGRFAHGLNYKENAA
jgi:hypothetical protein